MENRDSVVSILCNVRMQLIFIRIQTGRKRNIPSQFSSVSISLWNLKPNKEDLRNCCAPVDYHLPSFCSVLVVATSSREDGVEQRGDMGDLVELKELDYFFRRCDGLGVILLAVCTP